MPSSPVFNELYKKLNSRQKEAVDAILGPVMVIAGPGTGKTQILSLRIANILAKTDTSPDSILALTFTESAAHSMRRRLVDIIGSTAYRVNITTFHSFCNSIIQDFPDEFPRIIGSASVSNIQQITIVQEIILSGGAKKGDKVPENFTLLKPFGDPSYYVLPSLRMIQQLKRENISPKEFLAAVEREEEKIKAEATEKPTKKSRAKKDPDEKAERTVSAADLEKRIAKNKELARVYELYEEALRTGRLYDYEDMILEVIRVLETNQDMLNRLGEMYQFMLADEHQDANAAQNRLLELLTSFDDNPNLFIVGDEKQAIFRFQGASLENFLYFKKLFPRAKVIGLDTNYRSTQHILDASHSLIGKNRVQDEALRVKLTAGGEKAGDSGGKNGAAGAPTITLREFTEERYENAFVAEDIQKKIESGVKPSSIVIIYRENRDVFPLLTALERTPVPYVVRSDQNVLSDIEVRKLITLFKAVLSPAQDDLVALTLYFNFLNIDPLDAHVALEQAKKTHQPITRVLARAGEGAAAEVFANPLALRTLADHFKKWSTLARNRPVTEVFHKIALESGFTGHVMSLPGSVSIVLKVDALFREAEKLLETNPAATLADFDQYIDTLDKFNVLIKAGQAGTLTDAVELMTAHKSKGLEFEHVYIVGAADRHWGNKREQHLFRLPEHLAPTVGKEQGIEDERRLFYVALTRAKKHIYISYSKRDKSGKERLPSQFVGEIDPALVHVEDVSAREREIAAVPEVTKKIHPANTPNLLDKEFLAKRFLEQGFSVSALNNYLECPWRYFFLNLLRLPRPQSRAQLYGTAVHAALKACFTKVSEGEPVSKDYLIQTFTQTLRHEPLTDADFTLLLERGTKALSGYFDTYSAGWKGYSLSEYNIAGVFVDEPEHDVKILLRGTIDRIKFLSDDHVKVIDYKTGEPESRNAIMGKTKSSNGNYYRQLIFYKLLLEGSEHAKLGDGTAAPSGRSKLFMDSGDIDYIEPTEKGVYRCEEFVIEDSEVTELISTIQKASREILDLSFVDQTCGDADCEFCALRKTLSIG